MATAQRTINSYGASVYNQERELQKKAQKCVKQYEKLQQVQQIKNPHEALAAWKTYVSTLQSIHKNCIDAVDWDRIKRSRKPRAPQKTKTNEFEARLKLTNYTPSLLDKISRATQKKINRLTREIEVAKLADQKENDKKYGLYLDDLRNWETLQEIAQGIKNNKTDSYNSALQYFKPFAALQEFGDDIIYNFNDNALEIELHVFTEKIIPKYELIQTESGKIYKRMLSENQMQKLYQNHVYSSSLKIAREVFAYLPLEQVIVNTINSKNTVYNTENIDPIFSVTFDAKTIDNLTTSNLESTDEMLHFVESMQEKRTNTSRIAMSA